MKDPVDIVAIIIISTMCSLLLITVLSVIITGDRLSEGGLKQFGDMGNSMLAIVALWMGSKLNKK